ncbi:MAG: efflux RND transporter permease subunit [Gammaproteobacteria bacterium]
MTSEHHPASRFAGVLLKNRYAFVLLIGVIFMAGWSAISNMPRIEDPRITNRYPRIITQVPGASAERVEALVTDVLEDELKELSEIKKVESTSRAGISVIALELQDSITRDTNEAVFSKIRDRIATAANRFPAGASQPFFDDKSSAVAFSLVASVTWTRAEAPALGVLHRLSLDLADQLRDLDGTDVVRLYGAPREEISVEVDPDQLAALNLSVTQLAGRIAADDPKVPAGALRGRDRDLFVEVNGELDSAARIGAIPLRGAGAANLVRVDDVATVTRRWQEPAYDIARINGQRGILIAVRTEENIRVDNWAAAAKTVVADFKENIGPAVGVDIVFDQSGYTADRLSGLGTNLLAGAVVVMIVVFLGMGWRAAVVVGAALPLSGSLAVFGLTLFDQQLHQMSIFGMIIAIGLLIDNAIVMTDDIKQAIDRGKTPGQAARGAIAHLFIPLLASTLTTILGFMPVFLLPGAMGDFVGPIAISVVLALVASFFVSMTLIPAFAAMFLRPRSADGPGRFWRHGVRLEKTGKRYRQALATAVSRPLLTIALCLILPLGGFVLASTLGKEFFPPADRDQFEIQVWLPPATSIERTASVARAIETDLRQRDGVAAVHWLVGGSFPTIYYNRIMKQNGNPSYAHAMVYTDSVLAAKRLTAALQSQLSNAHPQAQIVVAPFSQGPPVDSPVGFRIQGPDTDTLRQLGDQVRAIMHQVPAITQTRASIRGGEPKLSLDADDEAAQLAGLSLTNVAAQLQASLEGQIGGAVLEDLESLPVRIRYARDERDSLAAISATRLVTPLSRDWIPIWALGELKLVPEAAGITRYNGQRVNNILGYLRADALALDVTNQILDLLEEENFTLPNGYTLEAAGDTEAQQDAFGSLLIYLPILMMLMITTLILSFRSVALAAVIGTVAFLAVGLGMLSLWIGQFALGFNAIIGSAGLIGVAINGTIVVLAALRADPDATRGQRDAIVRETVGATRHIVSTTLTTLGGFMPLLLLSGGDFWPPLAIVIAGGVGFSITLSLFFTPAVYRLLTRRLRFDAAAAVPA